MKVGKKVLLVAAAVIVLSAGILLYLFIPENVKPESLLNTDSFQFKGIEWKADEKAVSRAWRAPLKVDPFAEFIPANENVLNSADAIVMDGKKGTIKFNFRDGKLYQISLNFPDVGLTELPEQVLQECRRVYGTEDSASNGAYIWYKGETMLQIFMPKEIQGGPLMIGIGLQVEYQ
jgi:hypothetical protein